MTDNTPVYGFPFPELTDAPDGPQQFEDLALAIETVLVRMDSQIVQRVYTSSTTWNKPAGLKGIIVELQGGGGGSGGCATTAASQTSGSGGGKGGAYARFYLPASAVASSVSVTVGTGGAGGSAGNNSGSPGNASSFGAHGSAPGGAGGAGGGAAAISGASTSQSGGATSQSFTGTATNVLFISGSDGGDGYRINGSQMAIPGYGGASFLSGQQKQGPISSGQISASAGQAYGGGASGPANMLAAGNTQQAGAAGAAGVVIVTEIY